MIFPPTSVVLELARAKQLVWEMGAQYQNQSLLNRYHVLTANGPLRLTVPVVHVAAGASYGSVRVDGRQQWARTHWRTIASAYKAAPFFDHYAEPLEGFYKRFMHPPTSSLSATLLQEVAEYSVSFCLEALKVHICMVKTDEKAGLPVTYSSNSVILTRAPEALPPLPDRFAYTTVFGTVFEPTTSFLDALLCAGPHLLRSLV
jgi:hypothetical protein